MIRENLQRLNNLLLKYGAFVLLAIGSGIRLRQYFTMRSFWLDESFLVLNLRDRSYLQLLEPLDYSQVAPIGFLWLEKSMIHLFGVNELSLRFVPLLCSIASIWLIYLIAKQIANKKWALVAMLMFILPTGLTYYASEVKQYSLDVFFGLLLIWLFLRYSEKATNNHLLLLLISGIVAITCSNVAIFFIIIIFGIEVLTYFSGHEQLPKVLILGTTWALAFITYYILFIYQHPNQAGMEKFWSNYFMPQSNKAFEWLWYSYEYYLSNEYAFGFAVTNTRPILALILLGAVVLIKKNYQVALLIALPILIHLFLSLFHLYPFQGRLILYQIPLYILLIIQGLKFLSNLFRYSNILVLALLVHLLFRPALNSIDTFLTPNYREHIRPTLAYIKQHKLPGDKIYVYAGSKPAFAIYQNEYFSDDQIIIQGLKSVDNMQKFEDQYKTLTGRTWLIFSHPSPTDGITYIQEENKKENELDRFIGKGSHTFLIVYQ